MFKKFISYTKGYRIFTVLTPILVFVDAIIEIQIPKIMGEVVDNIYAIEKNGDSSALTKSLLWMLAYCLFTLIVGYIAARCSAVSSMGFTANIRRDLFNKVQDMSFENLDKLKISSLVTRMTADVSMITNMFKNILVTFVKGPYVLILALVRAIAISAKLSNVFYVVVPTVLVTLGLLGYFIVPLFKDMLKKTDRFNSVIRGNANNIRVVKSFVREEYEKEKFNEANEAIAQANIRAQNLALYLAPIIMIVIYGCMVAVLFVGSNLVFDRVDAGGDLSVGISVGELTQFTTYISQVISSLMTVLMAFITIVMARASVSRVGEIFETVPTISDEEGNPENKVEYGSIEFKDVTFRYNVIDRKEDASDKKKKKKKKSKDEEIQKAPVAVIPDEERNVLHNVSFKIEAGETVGIIGATGSAKSTIVNLIPRLYDVNEGQVLVDGKDVREYKFSALRDGVSVVMQQNILFSGTIKENIRWGKLDATDEEVEKAAKDAQAHDFILEKENGYDTELGHGGNTVSGGQRQRLCIARALLKKPKILIFDDSTSAVDTATDAKIKAALRTSDYEGITKIIVAQRITSIMDADKIIVLEKGRIMGVGSHDELKETNDIYRQIFISQQEGVLAE